MLQDFMHSINEELEPYWRSPDGPLGAASRQTAWVVDGGCRCFFRYGGVVVEPAPWPASMDSLMAEIMPMCGLGGLENKAAWPNSCNVNRYRYSGTDGNSWHKDDSPLFKGTEQDACIISLSLGGTRTLCVRHDAAAEESSPQPVQLELHHGDLCTMEGLLQKHYQHQVLCGSKSLKGRINLTWRWVVAHNCSLRQQEEAAEPGFEETSKMCGDVAEIVEASGVIAPATGAASDAKDAAASSAAAARAFSQWQ